VGDSLVVADPELHAEIVTDRHQPMESYVISNRPREYDEYASEDRSRQPLLTPDLCTLF
jgi:hypothetical protein